MQQTNTMAITSLIFSVIAWVMALLLGCFNLVILPIITVATLGAGAIFYICTGVVGLLSPIGWIVAVVTGNNAIKQIKQTGANGEGIAKTGIISAYIGLGITVLIVCGFTSMFLISAITGANYNSY